MIQNTLPATKAATFAVLVPHPRPEARGFPTPNGTAFFVSSDGYVITALHVLKRADGTVHNAADICLTKPEVQGPCEVRNLTIVRQWPDFDLALLKADFEPHREQPCFRDKTGFDYITIDFTTVPEGTQVYAFGYPLPDIQLQGNQQVIVGFHFFCPRTTSAIISSHNEVIGPVRIAVGFPESYVIDKALNYGNSGGPIVVEESGRVVAVCQRFQPVSIPQGTGTVQIPSLYGITRSLKTVEADLRNILHI
jgi:S1-C subfamily serine protease